MTPTTAAVTPGERAGERPVAAQALDVGRAEEDEEEAGKERHPRRHERADVALARRRAALRMVPARHEADELEHHDERSRRRLREARVRPRPARA